MKKHHILSGILPNCKEKENFRKIDETGKIY